MAPPASSYPVLWSELNGEPMHGELLTGRDAVELDGRRSGGTVHRTIAYRDVDAIRVGRTGADLLEGRPALVLEPHGSPPILIRPLGFGLLAELADLLAQLSRQSEPAKRISIVLPLRPDKVGTARALVAEGPPFDLVDKSLERHEVYVAGTEAVFVFSGENAFESVRRIVDDITLLPAFERWHECLAGAPRLAEADYAWPPPGDAA